MNKILSRKKFVASYHVFGYRGIARRCSALQILSSVKFWIFRSCQSKVVPPLLPSPPEPWPSMTSTSTGGPDWSQPPPDWRSQPGVPSSRRSWPPSGCVTAARSPPPSSSLPRTRHRTLSRRCSSPWVSGISYHHRLSPPWMRGWQRLTVLLIRYLLFMWSKVSVFICWIEPSNVQYCVDNGAMNFIIHDIYSTVEVTSDPTHPLKKSAIITASFFHFYSNT